MSSEVPVKISHQGLWAPAAQFHLLGQLGTIHGNHYSAGQMLHIASRTRPRIRLRACPLLKCQWDQDAIRPCWATSTTQCRAVGSQENVVSQSAEVHHPEHQTAGARFGSRSRGCESAEENASLQSEDQDRAPLLEAVVQAAARNDVGFGSPGLRKGAGAAEELREAFLPEVSAVIEAFVDAESKCKVLLVYTFFKR